MSGPSNAIMGDLDEPTILPETVVPELELTAEKNRYKYSKSREFKDIKDYWEARRTFFEGYLPGGQEMRFTVPGKEVAQQWVLANNIIAEINAFLRAYEEPKK